MSKLQQTLSRLVDERGLNSRSLATATGIPYPIVLALVKQGRMPRRIEQLEALRKHLDIDEATWGSLVASSRKGGVEIPSEGPLTLQQVVLKALLSRGMSERSFCEASGLPYPTVMNITRKGGLPRSEDFIEQLAGKLGLEPDLLREAIANSRSSRGAEAESEAETPASAESAPAAAGDGPGLAQLAADAVARSGLSIAAFAREHGIPYISLTTLLGSGAPPRRESALGALAKALGLDDAAFAAAVAGARSAPRPADTTQAAADAEARNPLHGALLKLVAEKRWNAREFADAAGLSALTAAKLLKAGELPGRASTHAKLQGLLGLDDAAYRALLGPAGAADAPAPIIRQMTPAGGVAAMGDADFGDLIGRLNARQRQALQAFLLTML